MASLKLCKGRSSSATAKRSPASRKESERTAKNDTDNECTMCFACSFARPHTASWIASNTEVIFGTFQGGSLPNYGVPFSPGPIIACSFHLRMSTVFSFLVIVLLPHLFNFSLVRFSVGSTTALRRSLEWINLTSIARTKRRGKIWSFSLLLSAHQVLSVGHNSHQTVAAYLSDLFNTNSTNLGTIKERRSERHPAEAAASVLFLRRLCEFFLGST